jgi:hypothetical protein
VFEVTGETYRIWVRNEETIHELFMLQQGERVGGIPNGSLLPGPGPGLHNAPWSWHVDPDDVHLADFTIELCDGWPGFVEDELDYWLDTVGQFCPWSAELVDLTDYR